MEAISKSDLLTGIPSLEHGFTTKILSEEDRTELEARTATAKQVHGDSLIWVSALEKRARDADALATMTPGLRVGVYSADCTPVLGVALLDGVPLAAIAIHAGWRGTAKKIVEKSLADFFTKTRAPGVKYLAAIGPCIGPGSFEVGTEVVDAFPGSEQAGLAKFLRMEEGKKKFLFDLPGENARQAKLSAERMKANLTLDLLAHCTLLQADRYPSFRRDREKAGRILSFVSFGG